MAKQLIDLGTNPNDGTGSNLRAGGTIINNNSTIHHYKLSPKRKIDQKIISQLKNVGVAIKIQ